MDDGILAKPALDGVNANGPASSYIEAQDEKHTRHGREVHKGFKVGHYLQTPPFFFTRDKWPLPLVDHYRGASCFLVAGGPSFSEIDKVKLASPGILTFAVNNSVKSFRPDFWTCVDDPASFIRSIWFDPKISKFVPISHVDKHIFDSDTWKMTDVKVGDCPNVIFYKRNEMFQAEQYLFEDSINWGNHTNLGGGRSVLLAAMRIMFLIGIRKIFLLGVDFQMDSGRKYHFDQDRAAGSIKGNMGTYRQLEERFQLLRPIFERNGLEVFNCNPKSNLKAFDFMPFDEAYSLSLGKMPSDLAAERTSGLYDRKANERAGKQPTVVMPPTPLKHTTEKKKSCDNCTRRHFEQVKAQVNAARTALHEAKAKTASYKELQEKLDPAYVASVLTELVADETKKRQVFRNLCKMRDNMVEG